MTVVFKHLFSNQFMTENAMVHWKGEHFGNIKTENVCFYFTMATNLSSFLALTGVLVLEERARGDRTGDLCFCSDQMQ